MNYNHRNLAEKTLKNYQINLDYKVNCFPDRKIIFLSESVKKRGGERNATQPKEDWLGFGILTQELLLIKRQKIHGSKR